MSNLTELVLNRNSLTSLPAEIGNLTNLGILGLIKNQLSFADTEMCKEKIPCLRFFYSPQDSLPTIVSNDSTFLFVSIGGSANSYQWYENGTEIEGAISDTLTIEKSSLATTTYICEAASSVITDLTLVSQGTLTNEEDLITSILHQEKSDLSTNVPKFSATLKNSRLTLLLGQTEKITVTIFDLRGRTMSKPFTENLNTGVHTFNLRNELSKGLYLVRVNGESRTVLTKISVIK